MTTNGSANNAAAINGHPPGGTAAMELNLNIRDNEDNDLYRELSNHTEGQDRNSFAISAMKIGVIALRQAQGWIDADHVRREGDRFIEIMGHTLDQHQHGVIEAIGNSLKSYFDPDSGQFSKRVKSLVDHDGELEQAIRRQVEGSDSILAQTLAGQIGPNSPLMGILNPESANGLLARLNKSIEDTLSEQRKLILSEFSLDNGESAISRLVAKLKENHGDVSKALEERIGTVVSEFSLDKKDSALSRLMHGVENAQKKISNEFDLNQDSSALAQMQKRLLEVIEKQSQTNLDFQTEVKTTLAAMTARRQETKRGTQHGLEFEDAVFDYIERWSQKAGDIAIRTGRTHGANKAFVGDAVIEIGQEHVAAGARVVVEAKQNQSSTISTAFAELKKARDNREADVGLFVFSAESAPKTLEQFNRDGNDIVIVWDAEDSASDVVFYAGLSAAKALCHRAKTHTDEVGADFTAIEKAISEVEEQIKELSQITKSANTIKTNSEQILTSANRVREALEVQVKTLNEKVSGLREAVGSTD